MNCPNCCRKMILLFTSAVCDNCDKKEPINEQVYYGWVAVTQDIQEAIQVGVVCVVFETYNELHDYYLKYQVSNYTTHRVSAKKPIAYYRETHSPSYYSLAPRDFPDDVKGFMSIVRVI